MNHLRINSVRALGPGLMLAAALVLAGCATGEEEVGEAAVAVDDGSADPGDETTDSPDDSGDSTDDPSAGGSDNSTDDTTADSSGGDDDRYDTGDLTNECPDEGCLAQISGVVANGDELDLELDANFAPDTNGNHFHIYWDNWAPEEVSANNAIGSWNATDSYPTYNTGEDSSTSVSGSDRDGNTEICLTPANGDHVVIDSHNDDCYDVTDLIG